MSRALILSIAAFACAASLALAADEYPARAVRIVVPFAPGGGTDVVGRILAQQLTQRLKQSFVIDNRPAGSGIVGADDGLVGHARPVQDASSGDRPAQPRGFAPCSTSPRSGATWSIRAWTLRAARPSNSAT